jgi:hypothetical protein
VRLTVTPERIVQLVPAAALVSFGVPDTSAACCDVRGAFCNRVHFFSDQWRARAGARRTRRRCWP